MRSIGDGVNYLLLYDHEIVFDPDVFPEYTSLLF